MACDVGLNATCSLQNTTSTSPHLCGEHSQTKAEQYQCGDITLLLGGAARMRLKPKGTDYRENRTSLIAWVQYHANAMQLQRSTAYAAVFLLDRLAAATDVANSVCRLAAATCLWLSVKYDDPDADLTSEQLYHMCEGHYPVKYFQKMERYVLNKLRWSVASASAYHFLYYFMQESKPKMAWGMADANTPTLSLHMAKVLDECVKDAWFLQHSPVTLAASLLYCQRVVWDGEMVKLTGHTVEQMQDCVDRARAVWERCRHTGMHAGTTDKGGAYSSPRSVLDGSLMCDEEMDSDIEDDGRDSVPPSVASMCVVDIDAVVDMNAE